MKYVIFLGGPQGSGKSTAAEFIQDCLLKTGVNVHLTKYAAPVYALHDLIQQFFEEQCGIPAKKKDGPLLQKAGTDIGRNHYGTEVWIDWMRRHLDSYFGKTDPSYPAVAVIEDVRFINEFELSEEYKAKGYKVTTIYFDAPLEDRKERVESFRENTSHQSEAELQQFIDRFEHKISTAGSVEDKNKRLAEIVDQLIEKVPPEKQFEDMVIFFNDALSWAQRELGMTANFGWEYDTETGNKKMKLLDVGPLSKSNTPELHAKAEAVRPVLEQAAEQTPQEVSNVLPTDGTGT